MRRATVAAVSLLAVVAALFAAISTGPFAVTPTDALGALVAPSSPDRFAIVELALPRYVVGSLAGFALGASGAIFQAVTRNHIASPDVLGFGSGAATGAIAVTVVSHGTLGAATVAAIGSGLITALVVHLLAGGLSAPPRRLIVTGVVVSAAITAVNSYLLMTADVQDTQLILGWLSGSLNAAAWSDVRVLAATPLVIFVALVWRREFGLLGFSDDIGTSLGVHPTHLRAGWLVIGVLLVAISTAATGPIAFVALAAPHIARRLCGGVLSGPFIPAMVGACLVTWSDFLTAKLLSAHPPVGIVTGVIGGIYLFTLLIQPTSSGRALSAR